MDLNRAIFEPWAYLESEYGGFDIKVHKGSLNEDVVIANARSEFIAKHIVELQNIKWSL